MFKKRKKKSEIARLKKEIEELEKKRYRSQAALVEAILKNITPSDEDTDYFNRYSAEIDLRRTSIHTLENELKSME